MQHWLDTAGRRRIGDPSKASLSDYGFNTPATVGPVAPGTDPLLQYQPTWVNKNNTILMDNKPVPVAKSDKTSPPAAKKTTAKQVQQQDLLGIAGNMLGYIRQAGITPPTDYFALYQIYHESQGFTSPLFSLHYNGSGIKYAGQKGATKQPTGLPYAWFTNWPDYMAALKHELTKGANPAGAATLEDFAARLKKNGYYEDSYAHYLQGLKNAQKALSGFTGGASSKSPYVKPDNAFEKWWHGLSFMHKLEYGAVGAIVGLVIIKKIV